MWCQSWWWKYGRGVDLDAADDAGTLLEVAVVVVEMWTVIEIRLVADALDVVESEERWYESEIRSVRPILSKDIQHKLTIL